MLFDLVKMRELHWDQKWRLVAEKELMSMLSTQLADQVRTRRRRSHDKLFASISLGHHQRRTESASDALFRTELRFQRATERTYEERCKPTKENQRNN